MKTRLILSLIALLCGEGKAAQILSSDLYLTVADGWNFRQIVSAEYLEEHGGEIEWYGRYPGLWYGLGGGQMLIQVDPGETITAASISYGVGSTASPTWTLQLDGSGTTSNEFLWHYYDLAYETAYSATNWTPVGFGYGTGTQPIYFEVQTSTGLYGQQFFIVPEPSTSILAGLAVSFFACARRRSISKY
jgi:hypothetical protein